MTRHYTGLGLLAVVLVAAGCGSPDHKGSASNKSASGSRAAELNGAGATFPYPVYAQWMHAYHQASGAKVNYQSIGSGGGIAQINAKTVDFGASDAPLKKKDLDAHGLIQFPMIMGGVVPVVNIKGVRPGQLRLSRKVLAGIFLGQVRKWNDPLIKKANPGLSLPGRAITVVHRADGSGTTWIFTNYLDKISTSWHEKVGTGKAVKWPAGVGGKGNEGVSAYVQRVNGAIGYVEFAYAIQNKLSHALLENKEGRYVAPTMAAFQAAAANADWANAPGFYLVLTNQPGKASWPITGASFILIHKDQGDKAKALAMLKYFAWCYQNGSETAKKLHYVSIPDNVAALVEERWRKEVRVSGAPVWR